MPYFTPIFSFLVFTPGSSQVRSSISTNFQKRTNVTFLPSAWTIPSFCLLAKYGALCFPMFSKHWRVAPWKTQIKMTQVYLFIYLCICILKTILHSDKTALSCSTSSFRRFTHKTAPKQWTCRGKATTLRTVHQFACSRGRLGTAGASWLRAERLSTGNGQENDMFSLQKLWSNLTLNPFFFTTLRLVSAAPSLLRWMR